MWHSQVSPIQSLLSILLLLDLPGPFGLTYACIRSTHPNIGHLHGSPTDPSVSYGGYFNATRRSKRKLLSNLSVFAGGQGQQARRPPPPQQPVTRPSSQSLARRPGMPYQGLPGPQQQGGLGSQPGAPQQPRPAQPRPFYNASQV